MSDKNFQHFLEVLNEVEAKQCKEWNERRLQPIPEKWSESDDRMNEHPVLPKLTTIRSKSKPVRHLLRKPGFVYRTKDLSKTTFLDNNLWEYTCGRRVLKAPTFKYRHKRKSALSPYSIHVLDGLSNLSLNSKPEQYTSVQSNPSPNPLPQVKNIATLKSLQTVDTPFPSNQFLPLSRSAKLSTKASRSHFPTRRKQIISRGKFSLPEQDSSHKEVVETTQQVSETPTWSNSTPRTSFGDLAAIQQEKEISLPKSYFQVDSPDFSSFSEQLKQAKNERHRHSKQSLNSDTESTDTGSSGNDYRNTSKPVANIERSCSFQARLCEQDMSVDELSSYMEDFLCLPQKMSSMAEMMYT